MHTTQYLYSACEQKLLAWKFECHWTEIMYITTYKPREQIDK